MRAGWRMKCWLCAGCWGEGDKRGEAKDKADPVYDHDDVDDFNR